MLELETLKTSVHKHEAIPERLATAEEALSTLKTSVAENKNEWTEIVGKNKSATPTTAGPEFAKEVRQVTKQLKEEETRKMNIVIHSAPEPKTGNTDQDAREDIKFFHDNITGLCEVAFTPDDIQECLRMGKLGEKEPRPILIKFTEQGARKKRLLFRNLNKFRDSQRENRGPDDQNKPFITVTDDLTDDQRKERAKQVAECKEKNLALEQPSDFLYAIRGPPWSMEIKKVTKKKTT